LAERSVKGNRVRGCGERLYGGTHRISLKTQERISWR
jgi:hypothetical protein